MFALAWKGLMTPRDDFPAWPKAAPRLALRLAVVALAVVAIHYALEWASDQAVAAQNQTLMLGALALVLLGYALMLAIPFVPGIEIGLSLLILHGSDVAPFVYAATVVGLSIAFVAGRLTPYAWLHAILRDLHWRRACDLVDRLEPMDRQDRIDHLAARLPERAKPWLKAGRYVLLAGLINLPGNALIGGGGGIAFIAGFSRLYSPGWTLLVFVVAVLPVPLVVWLTGVDILL